MTNKTTHILYVVNDLETDGGIQTFAKSTGAGLGQAYDLRYVSWSSPLSLPKKGCIFLAPSPLNKFLYSLWFRQNPTTIFQSSDYDLVHFWHIKATMALAGDINSPYIITCHGAEVLQMLVKAYERPKFIKALQGACAITTPSRYTKDYIVNQWGIESEKIVVTSPSVSLPNRITHRTKGRKKGTYVIGTLTRLVPRKNVLNVVKALGILKAKYGVDFIYYLAGDGPERAQIIKELGARDIEYKYFGRISEEDKFNNFYPALDVFVLPPIQSPRDFEGFGIVFLEANSCGVPVVAASTGGIIDAVNEGYSGVFADPAEPEDIADKIYALLISKKDYADYAHRWATSFSPQKKIAQFKQLYSKITSP